ncbi:MAG: TrkA family potassium uptake protein [Coriobacteriaceae bacterium]|nr:TrkA family potassium uptake protein [Coriobacteriaceae bacterium]
MNIIIVGCGRVGSQLAMLFSESDNNVVVIDNNPKAFNSLGRSFGGQTIVGVGFDEEILLEAGVEECDVLAAVTDRDNSNLMIAEVARKLFGVPHVLARLYNPDRETTYMQLGLDYVCGTTLVAEEIYSKIMAGHGNHVDTFGEYEVLRFSLDLSSIDNDSIRVADLERDHEIAIVAFERKDRSLSSIPTKDSILYHEDIVLACVRKELLEYFSTFMYS